MTRHRIFGTSFASIYPLVDELARGKKMTVILPECRAQTAK